MKSIFSKIFGGKIKYPDNVKCPNCEGILDKKPSRKTKCKLCKKDIYVRTSPKTNKKILVTKLGAKKVDKAWEEKSMINRWKRNFRSFGVDEEAYENYEKEIIKERNRVPNDRDMVWAIFNKLIFINHRDSQTLKGLYYSMALFLNEEKKNFFKILQMSAESALTHYKKDTKEYPNTKVIIMASDDSCDSCKALHNKAYSIDEALEKMPIPCKDCSRIMDDGIRGFCRCLYNTRTE